MIQSALAALIKTVHTRTFASVAPLKSSLPVITIDLESSFRDRYYGSSGYETGLIDTDFEISVWGKTNSSVFTLSQTVINLLQNYQGPLKGLDSPQTTYRICDIEITNEQSGFDGETEIYQYSIFLTITHTTAS